MIRTNMSEVSKRLLDRAARLRSALGDSFREHLVDELTNTADNPKGQGSKWCKARVVNKGGTNKTLIAIESQPMSPDERARLVQEAAVNALHKLSR